MKKIICAAAMLGGFVLSPAVWAMSELSDAELAEVDGQALFNLSYLSPSDTGNYELASNIGFYRLGVEAEIAANLNIKKLQLGCGGINGAGACDIDIDNLSLSGNSATSAGRVQSDAVLTNPFFEFAIKNPNIAATREVVGFRVGSEAANGLLTFGLENLKTPQNDGIPNGINSFSGYMEIAPQTGLATVNSIQITQNGSPNPTGVALSGIACSGPYFGGCGIIQTTYSTTSYTLDLTPTQQATLTLPFQTISGRRMQNVLLTATSSVSGINITGSLSADTGLGLPLSGTTSGVLNNLPIIATIDENLGLFHKASLNNSPFSLALQSQNMRWPGTKSNAQRGWWMELSNPIDIGDVTPNKNIDIPIQTVKEALGITNDYLANNWVFCGVFAISCLAGNINIGNINLPATATPANMLLSNLSLQNQDFAPNCYGGLKFC